MNHLCLIFGVHISENRFLRITSPQYDPNSGTEAPIKPRKTALAPYEQQYDLQPILGSSTRRDLEYWASYKLCQISL